MLDMGKTRPTEHALFVAAEGNTSMQQLIQRVEKVLEDERLCLQGTPISDLEQVIARKDQLALELQRLSLHRSALPLDAEDRALLGRMTRSLDGNAKLLKRHIEAANEIAGLITRILSSASTDGTYTSRVVGRKLRS